MKVSQFLIVFFALLGLTACGGGGGGGSSSSSRSLDVSTENLVGLYDMSYEEDGKEDVLYIYLADDGNIYVVDYLGDEYDDYDDCYYVSGDGEWSLSGNVLTLVELDGGAYPYNIDKLTSSKLEISGIGFDHDWELDRVDLDPEEFSYCGA